MSVMKIQLIFGGVKTALEIERGLILSLFHCLLVLSHFFKLLVLLKNKKKHNIIIFNVTQADVGAPLRAYLLLKLLIEGCQPGSAVLFVRLHLLIQFLLGLLAKVAAFLNGLLDDLLLVLSLLGEMFQHFSFVALTDRQNNCCTL